MNNWALYTKEQLLEMHKEIAAEFNKRNAAEKAVAIQKFAAGDKVWYIGRGGVRMNCTIEKILRTNVDVITTNGDRVRCPANLLHFQMENK